MKNKEMKTFARAVNEGIQQAMRDDNQVICYGLGVTDPKGVFGTTLGLEREFGESRVFDTPTSENALTGVAIGASMAGVKTVMCHQRADFFLLALDQLVNGAAKWRYMFGEQHSIPITIRLIIGRGWGQGPTHSQNLQSWFAHIPGLKVLMPSNPQSAKKLLYSSILDPDPVVFLEHRWLHNAKGLVSENAKTTELNRSEILKNGKDITIVAMSYLTVETLRADEFLSAKGISVEIIDLITVNPIDWSTLFKSVKKTGRLLVLDTGNATCSVSSEILASVTMKHMSSFKCVPRRLAMPDIPEPSGFSLTKNLFITAAKIATSVQEMLGNSTQDIKTHFLEDNPHDVPGDWFTGPF